MNVKWLHSETFQAFAILSGCCHSCPNFFASHSRNCRGHYYMVLTQCFRNHPCADRQLIARQLVCLGCDQQTLDFPMLQPFCQLQVQCGGRDPRIDQLDDQRHRATIAKILLCQNPPLPAQFLSGFCIAEAGQIDKVKSTIVFIKINALCFARLRTCSGKTSDFCQPIDQAGFADIGSSRERDFGKSVGWKIARPHGTDNKFGVDHVRFIVRYCWIMPYRWAILKLRK